MDVNDVKKIQEKLEVIKGEMERKLNKSQEDLNKIDQLKDAKTYAEGEQEVSVRKKELEDLISKIETFNKMNDEITKLNVEAIKKDKQQKEVSLKKAQDELAKTDSVKDAKSYKEIQEEISRRKKELEEVNDRYQSASKKIEELDKFYAELDKKYHIEKMEEKKTENNNEKKTENKDEELSKKIAKKEAEVRKAEKIMANFGTPGFNGAEELEKYKKLMKELEELKYGKVNKEEKAKSTEPKNTNSKKKERKHYFPTQEELDKYINLKKKGLDDNSTEMKEFFNNIVKKREMNVERDEDGNLKYPPADTLERDKDGNLKYSPAEIIQPMPQKTPVEEIKKDKPLSIIYSGKDNQYIVTNFEPIIASVNFENENEKLQYIREWTEYLSKPIEAINFKNKKERLEYLKTQYDEDTLKYIFGDNYNKTMKKLVKTYDPQVVEILVGLNPDFAKRYISELSKGKDDKKEPLPYTMKYNLKGMKKNHRNNKMTILQRIRTNRMAKRNYKKGVAEYVPDDKNRKWLAIPVIGALAAGGLAIANNERTPEKTTPNHTPEVTDTTETPVTTKTTSTTKVTSTTKITPTRTQAVLSDKIEKAVEEGLNNAQQNNNTDDLSLGSKVSLPEGITYAEDSLGNGLTGKIGEVSWRPAGDYTIDRVALYHNGKLLENLSTEGTNVDEAVRKYASKLGVEPSEIVQKAHICVGEKHNGATGWLNMEEVSIQDLKNNISKTYEELQQEKASNNKKETQKTNQEQNHEDR